ncbi:MAG: ribosomal protein S18-alanine N-acetyltransferase [Candidatus Nanopelagicales bacterium]
MKAMIRPMKWWDLERVIGIERRVFSATAWPPESFWGELARDDRYYVVAGRTEEDVRAYAGLWLMPPDADVQTIAVAPGAQGQGLGRQLLDHLVHHARAQRCRRMHLEVKADNEAAIALYRGRGFDQVRLRARYYPDFSDALVMGLDL